MSYFSVFKNDKILVIGIKTTETRYKRGVACRRCNTQMQEKPMAALPLYFHNSTGFDSHMLLKFFPASAQGKLTGIPCSEEKFKVLYYSGITALFDIKTLRNSVILYLSNNKNIIICHLMLVFDKVTKSWIAWLSCLHRFRIFPLHYQRREGKIPKNLVIYTALISSG